MDDFYDFLFEEPKHTNPEPQPVQSYAAPAPTSPAEPVGSGKHLKASRRKFGFGPIIAIALVCSLLGSLLGAGGVLLATRNTAPESALSDAAEPTSPALNDSKTVEAQGLLSNHDNSERNLVQTDNGSVLTPTQVYTKNVNSTVGITTEIQSTNYWGDRSTGAAAGSGFIISQDGYIMTNQHVIEGATSIKVTLYSGERYTAEVVGSDSANDIAVLKIDAQDLTPVTVGNSDSLNVGDTVMAIGNPMGELTFSLTAGIVSALNRDITMSGGSTMRLIQTDAAINAGNSGGALFNSYGEVIGVTNAKYSSNAFSGEAEIDNIGFAIPINTAMKIASAIMETGHYAHPYLGVSVTDVTDELKQSGSPDGALIAELTEDAPAANAGLKVGDIITAANDRAISGSSDLVGFVSECAVGDNVIFTVYRDGESLQISVLIGERPQQVQQELETEEQQPSNPWGDGENGEGWGFGDGEGGWDFGDGWFGFGDDDGNGGWSFNFGGH